jgi:Co/Zn/Cd efflux system component
MVVVPTSHDVTLSYGRSAANNLGQFLSLVGLVALVLMFVVPAVRRWWRPRSGTESPGPEGASPA